MKHQVGALAGFDGPAIGDLAQGAGGVGGAGHQRLGRGQPRLHQQLHLAQGRDPVRRARHAGVGAKHHIDARVAQRLHIPQRVAELGDRLAPRRGVGLGPAGLVGIVDRERRRIGRAGRLDQRHGLGVDRLVLQAVGDDVDLGARRDPAALDRDRVGQDLDVVLMGLVHQGRERALVHAGVVGRDAVAPAVREGLDEVGLVGDQRLHLGARVLPRPPARNRRPDIRRPTRSPRRWLRSSPMARSAYRPDPGSPAPPTARRSFPRRRR